MAEDFKLPGSSYEEIIKIIKGYSSCKLGETLSLSELSQCTGIANSTISRNSGFLIQSQLITDGSKKGPTELCIKLAKAYHLNMTEEVKVIWRSIINNNMYLTRMSEAIRIKAKMKKSEFLNHIMYSASGKSTGTQKAGASAIIDIFIFVNLIEEKDSMLYYKEQSAIKKESQNTAEEKNIPFLHEVEERNADLCVKQQANFIQSYMFESGEEAKIIIPLNASKDDLLALKDMLDIVLKRKFKLEDI